MERLTTAKAVICTIMFVIVFYFLICITNTICNELFPSMSAYRIMTAVAVYELTMKFYNWMRRTE